MGIYRVRTRKIENVNHKFKVCYYILSKIILIKYYCMDKWKCISDNGPHVEGGANHEQGACDVCGFSVWKSGDELRFDN